MQQLFAGNSKLNWSLFTDEFKSGVRVGCNFQGSEDLAYLFDRAKRLFDTEKGVWTTAPTFSYFVSRAIDEIAMRNFEFWNPWSDSAIVAPA
jgi:hypothetical protein